MKIPFNDLQSQWNLIKEDCYNDFDLLFDKSNFILGSWVKEFEDKFAEYVNCKYAVGVSNGTDAITLASRALSLKGKTLTIIPANTYVATILGMEQGLICTDVKLIDCDMYHQMDISLLKECLMENSHKYDNIVIVPVHLYGYTCDMTNIMKLSEEYNCIVLEDASQAHGAKHKGQTVGCFGKVSAFSLYPGKNLGAAGDAGIVTTNDEQIYNKLLSLRNIGSIKKYEHNIKGYNHRLDTIQAIILNHKMKYIENWNTDRRRIIKSIVAKVENKNIKLPLCPEDCIPVHHIFPVIVNDRSKFQQYLNDHNIQHGIHYPILIEQMPMYKHLSNNNQVAIKFSGSMVSLPIHPFMSDEEINYLSKILNNYGE
tara:strand:+ start:681 stop:1790 length:1110 start_codon:yes stop_codon:yes gene_type:complete